MLLTILFILFLMVAILCMSFKIFGWIILKMLAIGAVALFVVVGALVVFLSIIGVIII